MPGHEIRPDGFLPLTMAGAREILFESVKALERQTAGLHALSRFAGSPGKAEEVLPEVLDQVMELVGANAGAIVLADEESGVFDFATVRWRGFPAVQAAAKEKALRLFRVRLTEGIIGQVYQSREPVILPDVSKSQTFRKDMAAAVNYQIENLLAVPIQTEAARVGVLELFNKVPRGTFSGRDMELAAALAHQIALVLQVFRVRAEAVAVAVKAAPPPASEVSPEDLQEARRSAREAQTQRQETQRLLDAAVQGRDHALRQVQSLTDELQRTKSLAEGSTPAHQMTRLLRSVEPIAFTLSPESVMKNFAELTARLVNAQAMQIFLWDEVGERFTLGYSTAPAALGKGIPLVFRKGEGLAGFSAERMELVHVEDVTREDHFSKSIDEVPGVLTRTVLAGPLAANGRLVGVIEAINRKDGQPFTSEDGVGLAGLALMGAAALEKALSHRELMETSRALVAALVDAAESRGSAPTGRADRIRRMTLAMGEALGMKAKDLREAEWAALLYNVGKVAVPFELFNKSGEFVPKDRDLVLSVPVISSEILIPISSLAGSVPVVKHVNERWDGQGVPDRKAGEEIPLGSRVIAVVDAFEGLTSGLSGRRALPVEVALQEIAGCAGKQFDPACVETLLRLGRTGKIRTASPA